LLVIESQQMLRAALTIVVPPFLLFVRSVFQRIAARPRVNGEFFNSVVEKIAEECNYAGRNRVARSEYDNRIGVNFCD
jgi:hypothetical protein